jgi:hypothetical protein
MRAVKMVAGPLVGAAGLGAAAVVVGGIRFQRRMAAETDELLADARPPGRASVHASQLQRLPEPVRRWLRYSQVVGMQQPATVRLRQEGEFQIQAKRWVPFRAEQYFTTNPPGFCGRRRSAWRRSSPLSGGIGTVPARRVCRCGPCR